MNQRDAIVLTLEKLVEVGYDNVEHEEEGVGFEHFVDMLKRIIEADQAGKPFSETKIARWLGWIQGAACASSCGDFTLEMAKEINKSCADDK